MSVLEFLTASSGASTTSVFHCPVCSEEFETAKLLKHHILFSHEKKIFCFYCLEKKGWSDEFVKQRNYHEHFDKFHTDVLQTRRRRRLEEEAERRRNPRKRASDGLVRDHPNSCTYCPNLPPSRFVWDRDKHLVDQHQHDFCNICRLIGCSLDVSEHMLREHEGTTCHLCRSLSPPFKPHNLRHHLSRAHNMTVDRLKCPGGGCPGTFTSLRNLAVHLKEEHGCSEKNLRRLKRNVKSRVDRGLTSQELEQYKGLRNDGHRHCHILSVLLMLAHTPLPTLIKPHSVDCSLHGSCLLAQLFDQYRRSAYNLYPRNLLESPELFNVQEFPYSIGEVLRLFLDESMLNTDGGRKVGELVTSRLEWKHHCERCDQFSHTRAREIVIKLNATENKSLVQHITDYLERRVCVCGAFIQTKPFKAEFAEFLFLEIDRTRPSNNKNCVELSLYPLQLQDTISINGITYSVVSLVNPDVGLDGHYSTNFVRNHQIVSIHETSVTLKTMYPGFDQTSLLVALQRMRDTPAKDDILVEDNQANAKDNVSDDNTNLPVIVNTVLPAANDVVIKTPVTAFDPHGMILDLSLISTSSQTVRTQSNSICATSIASKPKVEVLSIPSSLNAFRAQPSEYKSDNRSDSITILGTSDSPEMTWPSEKQIGNMATMSGTQRTQHDNGVSPSLMPSDGAIGQDQALLALPPEILGTISLPLTLDTTGAPWMEVGSLEGVVGPLQEGERPLEEVVGPPLQREEGPSINHNRSCNLTTPEPFKLTGQNANSGIQGPEIGAMCDLSSGFEAAQPESKTHCEQSERIPNNRADDGKQGYGESSEEIGRSFVRRSEIVASALRNANICDSDLQGAEIGDFASECAETDSTNNPRRETNQPRSKKEYVEFSFQGKQRRSKYLSEESLKLLLESDPLLLVKHREKYRAEMEHKLSQKFKRSTPGVSAKLKSGAQQRRSKPKESPGGIDYSSSSAQDSTCFNPADLF